MTNKVSLTQYLNFTSAVSTSARINAVKRIKYSSAYSPATDYWKPVRDTIKKYHQDGLEVDYLRSVLKKNYPDDKIRNYTRVINKYSSFIKNKDIEYFDAGSSYFKISEDLTILTNPELGLKIDGKRYFLKNWYKVPSKKNSVTKKQISSTLTMMQLSSNNFENADEGTFAILNLQNGKLIEASETNADSILEMNVEMNSFANIWDSI